MDEQGRYKVILPFDISGRAKGKGSAWLRMMQPFTGPDYGMHFPLRKGSEVLLTFVDGNPDRPIISGAVPNPETRSVVEAGNQDRSGFQTAGGSSFYSDDRPGHQHMMFNFWIGTRVMYSPEIEDSTLVKGGCLNLRTGEPAGLFSINIAMIGYLPFFSLMIL